MKRIEVGALPWFLFSGFFLVIWYLLERKVLLLNWPMVIGTGAFCLGMALANLCVFTYSEAIRQKNVWWGVIGIMWVGSFCLRLPVWHIAPKSIELYVFCGAAWLAYASFIRIRRKQPAY